MKLRRNGKRADFAVKVADETGKDIYAAEMHFAAKTEADMGREDEADAAADDVASSLDGRGARD